MSSLSVIEPRVGDIRWSEPLLSGAVIGVFVLALISVAVPIATIGFDIAKSYNEGWNAYHAARVAAGEPLYTGDPARLVNYPFLSFYLVAALKPLFGNVLMIGRVINATAFGMTAILSALIIRQLGADAVERLFGAACVIGFQVIQAESWIAADEPQMLAEALMLGGLLCYVSGAPDLRRLAVCAALFAAGAFTKQNVIAIPLAVSFDLLAKDRRQFLIWCLCGAAALALFVGLSEALAGSGFWTEVFAPRTYHGRNVLYHGRKLLIAFKWPILVGALYLWRPFPASHIVLLRSYGVSALIAGLVFSGGYGVAGNIFLDFAVFLGLASALALGGLRRAMRTARIQFGGLTLAPLICALPLLTRSAIFAAPPLDLPATLRDYQRQDANYHATVTVLQKEPGPILCEDLLLCFEAGKPLIVDLFSVNSQILSGRLDRATLLDEIAQHRFSLIELPVPIHPDPDQPARFSPYLLNQGRFNEQTLSAIDRFYEPVRDAGGAVLLAPRAGREPAPGVTVGAATAANLGL